MRADSECPYNCINGQVFDHLSKMLVPCPHCSEKLNKIVNGQEKTEDGRDVHKLLNIPPRYKTKEFTASNLIPDMDLMSNESVTEVLSELDNIMAKARVGEVIDYSVMFNLGREADILNFIYNYLKICLVSGMSVSPLVSSTDVLALRYLDNSIRSNEYQKVYERLGVSYFDLERNDVCVVTIDAGGNNYEWGIVKGLLEARERNGLPTLVFTNSSHVLSYGSSEKNLHSAHLISVKYLTESLGSSFKELSNTIIRLLTAGNKYVSSYVAYEISNKASDEFNKAIKLINLICDNSNSILDKSDLTNILKDICKECAVFGKLDVNYIDKMNVNKMLVYIKAIVSKLEFCRDAFLPKSAVAKPNDSVQNEVGNKPVSMEDLANLSSNNSIFEAYTLGQRGSL